MSSQVVQIKRSKREDHVKHGLRLQYVTIFYNSLEGIIAISSGLIAGSVALIGFGFDSFIEVTSGAALLWRLHSDTNEQKRERAEKMSLRIVGICFLILALYISYDSISSLWKREAPEESIVGIVLSIGSLIAMPLLVRAKRKVAKNIGSIALQADAKQTELCTYLSAILLGGLLLNAVLGWWWADPAAALAMTPIMVKEGIEALQGKACCHEGGCH
jgi:divalent metal cation (Fe/Co/Zn/Cd) transporter